jgi:hypothetical protein
LVLPTLLLLASMSGPEMIGPEMRAPLPPLGMMLLLDVDSDVLFPFCDWAAEVQPVRPAVHERDIIFDKQGDVLHADEVEPEPDLDVEPLTAPTVSMPFAMAPSTSLCKRLVTVALTKQHVYVPDLLAASACVTVTLEEAVRDGVQVVKTAEVVAGVNDRGVGPRQGDAGATVKALSRGGR